MKNNDMGCTSGEPTIWEGTPEPPNALREVLDNATQFGSGFEFDNLKLIIDDVRKLPADEQYDAIHEALLGELESNLNCSEVVDQLAELVDSTDWDVI